MIITVWIVLCSVLAVYAGFTVALYFLKLRPLLRSGRVRIGRADLEQQGCLTAQAETELAGLSTDAEKEAGALSSENSADRLTLQLSREEWRYTFDAILDPILILDRDMTVVKGNRAAFQLLSVNGAPIEGKRCHQLFTGKGNPCAICPARQVLQSSAPYKKDITHRYLGRTFAVSCSPITSNGELLGFVHSAKDISIQHNLEKRLVHAHKLESVATLAGGIAHDFNNILGAILGNADLLLYRLPAATNADKPLFGPPITPDEIVEHVQAIKRAGNRARDLVAQILAFSRQSTNQRRNIYIAPIIKEACRLLRASIPTTIEIHVAVAEEIGMIYADPIQIQQVLMNLCSNATQALENKAGAIDIALREIESGEAERIRYHNLEPGRYVVLSVKDTGKGISADMLERIFDPFYTTRDVGEGSGMGLAVLHGIILSHDGVIDVQSEVDKGTVFTVFFPKVAVEGEGEEDQITAMPRGTGTILFVDDEEDIVKMRTRMLSYLGYRVLTATGPEQALSYFTRNEEQIDLVITDHTMPRMTGVQLASEISAMKPDLPIFLCSGYSEAVTPEESERAGICRFLAKPVDMRMLAVAIRDFLPRQGGGNQ